MSDEIAKDSSASMAIENAENVIKAEFDKLKLKLEETEAELQKEKKKTEKFTSLSTLVAPNGVKLRPKRSKICLTLPKCAELFPKGFSILSDPVELAGFQWKLAAKSAVGYLDLFLLFSPPRRKGHYEFDFSISFRVLNAFPAQDMDRELTKKFKQCEPSERFVCTAIMQEQLLDPANNFVQEDGSIQLEVHFTVVEIATLDQLLADVEENGNKKNSN